MRATTMRKYIAQFVILSAALAAAIGLQSVSAWTGATANPPNNNKAVPINQTDTAQVKSGGLGILGNLYTYQRVGIGTNMSNPQYSIDLGADTDPARQGIRFADGTVQTSAGAAITFTKYLQVQERYAAGTTGPTLAGGAWVTRVLNTTVTNTIPGATISSNRITLPAGTYYIDADSSVFSAQMLRNALYNVTDGTFTILGLNSKPNGGGEDQDSDSSPVTGMFTITSTKTFELRSRLAESGFGYTAGNWGISEVYTDVQIWKVQ